MSPPPSLYGFMTATPRLSGGLDQDSQGLLVKRVTKDLQVFPGATTCMKTLIHCVDSYPIPRLLRPNEGAPASHQWYECQGGQRGISQIGTHCTSQSSAVHTIAQVQQIADGPPPYDVSTLDQYSALDGLGTLLFQMTRWLQINMTSPPPSVLHLGGKCPQQLKPCIVRQFHKNM